MSTETFVSALVRWFDFAVFAALAGAAGLELAVLPRRAAEIEGVRRRLRRVSGLAVIVLLVTGAGELGVRARTMAGGGIETTLAAIPSVLARTHFGKIWMLRAAALGLLWLLLRAECRLGRSTTLLPIAAVALTTSLTGHAADRGDLSLAVLADWLHVLSSAAWTGGLLCLACLALGKAERPARVDELARRFSRLAGICLLGVVASGSYNAWIELGTPSALWSTGYGRILAVKLAFVLALIGFGAENRFRVVPALDPKDRGGLAARCFTAVRRPTGGAPGTPEVRFWRLVAREAALVLIVFACTALLVESPPPRHRHHHAPDAAAEPANSPLGAPASIVRASPR